MISLLSYRIILLTVRDIDYNNSERRTSEDRNVYTRKNLYTYIFDYFDIFHSVEHCEHSLTR